MKVASIDLNYAIHIYESILSGCIKLDHLHAYFLVEKLTDVICDVVFL